MTKAELRALTAALVPNPEAHPNFYRHPHAGAGTGAISVHVKPAVREVPNIRAPRPKRTMRFPGHRILPVPTFKPFKEN